MGKWETNNTVFCDPESLSVSHDSMQSSALVLRDCLRLSTFNPSHKKHHSLDATLRWKHTALCATRERVLQSHHHEERVLKAPCFHWNDSLSLNNAVITHVVSPRFCHVAPLLHFAYRAALPNSYYSAELQKSFWGETINQTRFWHNLHTYSPISSTIYILSPFFTTVYRTAFFGSLSFWCGPILLSFQG